MGANNLLDDDISNQPDNLSSLAPNSYTLVIERIPTVLFTCQRVDIPGVNVTKVDHPNPTPWETSDASEKVYLDDLIFAFIVDEDLQNYFELFDWLMANKESNKTITSDVTLTVHNNAFNRNRKIKFLYGFPTSLGPISLDTSMSPDAPLLCDVTFSITSMEILPSTT